MEREFNLAKGASLVNEEADIGLFEDEVTLQVKTASIQALCAICELALEGKVGKDCEGSPAHLSCVEDMIITGAYSVDDTQLAELNNNVYSHVWTRKHPDVVNEGCLICRGELEGDLFLVEKHPKPYFVHKDCLASAVKVASISGTDLNRILGMNTDQDILTWFHNQSWPCTACLHPVQEPIILPSGRLIHKECLTKKVEAGQVTSWELVKICNLNGADAVEFEEASSMTKVEEKLPDLVKEAEGVLQNLWTRFTNWLRGLGGKVVNAIESYDEGIAALEQAYQALGVEASLEKSAIDPEIQQAMNLLAEMERIEAERAKKIEALMAQYQITELTETKSALAAKVKEYLEKLTSKQRRYAGAIFRLKDVKHRTQVSYKNFMAALRMAYAQQQQILESINALESQATTQSFSTKEVEVLLEEGNKEIAPGTPEGGAEVKPA